MEDDEDEDVSSKMKNMEGEFWKKMSVERVRDHPFVAALFLSIFIKILYNVMIYFSPLIISTMLCVLAFIRIGPLLQQSREEYPSKLDEGAFQVKLQEQDDDPWWKQLDGLNFVMATLRELYYLALENAEDMEMAKEISDKFEVIVVALGEFSSSLRKIITDKAPPILENLPDKRSIVTKACQVGDMLGVDLNMPIRTIGTFLDEVISEDPVNYMQEMMVDDTRPPELEVTEPELVVKERLTMPELVVDEQPLSPPPRTPLPPPPPPPLEVHLEDIPDEEDDAESSCFISSTSLDEQEAMDDPFVRLFAESDSLDAERIVDDEDYLCSRDRFYHGTNRQVIMFERRKHFLSDLLLLPSLLRATRRYFMACFCHRMPRQQTRLVINY